MHDIYCREFSHGTLIWTTQSSKDTVQNFQKCIYTICKKSTKTWKFKAVYIVRIRRLSYRSGFFFPKKNCTQWLKGSKQRERSWKKNQVTECCQLLLVVYTIMKTFSSHGWPAWHWAIVKHQRRSAKQSVNTTPHCLPTAQLHTSQHPPCLVCIPFLIPICQITCVSPSPFCRAVDKLQIVTLFRQWSQFRLFWQCKSQQNPTVFGAFKMDFGVISDYFQSCKMLTQALLAKIKLQTKVNSAVVQNLVITRTISCRSSGTDQHSGSFPS